MTTFTAALLLPRVLPRLAEVPAIRRGPRGQGALREIYPNWGEGPKPYIFMKLGEPKQDVDKLLAEWYDRCVGPAAAPDLAKFYAIWERFWTKDILKSNGSRRAGSTWPLQPGYLADVKKEDSSRAAACSTRRLPSANPRAARARRTLEKAFQYYEASVLAYQCGLGAPDSVED